MPKLFIAFSFTQVRKETISLLKQFPHVYHTMALHSYTLYDVLKQKKKKSLCFFFFWLSHRFLTYHLWTTNLARLAKRYSPWESNSVFPGYVLGRSSLPLEPKQLGYMLILLSHQKREKLMSPYTVKFFGLGIFSLFCILSWKLIMISETK